MNKLPPSRSAARVLIAWALAAAAMSGPAAAADDTAPRWTHPLGMVFVRIPAGEFWMGSDLDPAALARALPTMEAQRFAELVDEQPRHRVRLTRPYWLGQQEVTVGQFRRFLAASGHRPESVADGTGGYGYRADDDPATNRRADAFAGRDPRYSWADPGFPQGDDHPVVNVSWNDAQAMARWLSAQDGLRYRLPTEAECEYACRAGDNHLYPGADHPSALQGQANLFDQDSAARWPQWRAHAMPWRDGFAFTAPVGRFAPNAFGLHDMLGNAWEWTGDWYAEDAYAQGPRTDPRGADDGWVRVRRGGSWHGWALYTRCGYRNVKSRRPATR